MAEQDELLQAVLDNPDDDAPRLAYAEWCAQQTDEATRARARFIRMQLGLAHLGDDAEPFIKYTLEDQATTLLQDYQTNWTAPLANLVAGYEFDRGFVALVTVSVSNFLDHAAELFALAPIQHLNLTWVHGWATELFSSAYLLNILSLGMDRSGLDDGDLKLFAASPNVQNIRWLSVIYNSISMQGAGAVAASTNLTQLAYANFSGNLVDLEEHFSQDNGFI